MDVHAWDSTFVRARRRDVHAILREVLTWGQWWPGMRVAAVPEARSGKAPAASEVSGAGALDAAAGPGLPVGLRLTPPNWPRRPQRLQFTLAKERRDLGIRWRCGGDVSGEAEFYYLDEPAGVVVSYQLRGSFAGRGGHGWLVRHRAAVRAGLHALKDGLEGDRPPGAEPDAGLLADQQVAAAEFAERVAASQRRGEDAARAARP